MEYEIHKPLYFEGEYQFFEHNDGRKWRRKFDFKGTGDHGDWELISD